MHFMAGRSKDDRKESSAKDKAAKDKAAKDTAAKDRAAKRDAEWTNGLKKLYDSVVEEPLPDSFQDLLRKLDTED